MLLNEAERWLEDYERIDSNTANLQSIQNYGKDVENKINELCYDISLKLDSNIRAEDFATIDSICCELLLCKLYRIISDGNKDYSNFALKYNVNKNFTKLKLELFYYRLDELNNTALKCASIINYFEKLKYAVSYWPTYHINPNKIDIEALNYCITMSPAYNNLRMIL